MSINACTTVRLGVENLGEDGASGWRIDRSQPAIRRRILADGVKSGRGWGCVETVSGTQSLGCKLCFTCYVRLKTQHNNIDSLHAISNVLSRKAICCAILHTCTCFCPTTPEPQLHLLKKRVVMRGVRLSALAPTLHKACDACEVRRPTRRRCCRDAWLTRFSASP